MSADTKLLIIVLLILTISGFIGYLIMAKAKNFIASKMAFTALVSLFLMMITIKKLLLSDEPLIDWSYLGWGLFIFIFVFFSIRGILIIKSERNRQS